METRIFRYCQIPVEPLNDFSQGLPVVLVQFGVIPQPISKPKQSFL
jgi:hypothetical protein